MQLSRESFSSWKSLQSAIQKLIQTALVGLRDEVNKAMMNELEKFRENSELKMWCESERLENYNMRDNLRIFNLKEDEITINERKQGEDSHVSMQKVLSVANKLEANVTAQDISIAHRVRTCNQRSERPIIVRFNRRVAKIDILKKFLQDLSDLRSVEYLEISQSQESASET